jgi:hypothetical protein
LKESSNLAEIILIALLIILPLIMIFTIFYLAGPQWDLMVRSLLGKTLLNYFTHNVNPQSAFIGEFTNNLLFYFEPYREPISTIIFAFLSIFFNQTIIPYILLTYLVYILVFYRFSKELNLDMLIAFTVFLNAFLAYFLFLPNGGEVLCVIFLLVALVYLLRKNPMAGAFLAIATLSKYPAIAFLPVVLLLGSKKKIVIAIALEAIVLALWSIFDYIIYANPFYSYLASITNSNVTAGASAVNLYAILSILAYPATIAFIAFVALYIKRQKIKIQLSYNTKLFLSFIVLALIEAIVIIPHNNPETQARYGYLLSITLLIPAALLLNTATQKIPKLKYYVAASMAAVLICTIYAAYANASVFSVAYYNPDSASNIYTHAWSELNALGYGNCRFISNAWVPMLYSGYDAYSPFIVYSNSTITPIVMRLVADRGGNYPQYVDQELQYPIIAFKYLGVEESLIVNINRSRLAYSDGNVSIYLPQNVNCYNNRVIT